MDFRERIRAVLHHQAPDMVPFAPYENHSPRGEFQRELRNRGMGLLLRRPAVWTEQPNVRVETVQQGEVETTLYHTPVGTVRTRRRVHQSRRHGAGRSIQIEGLIKNVEDTDAVIFIADDTQYHADPSICIDTRRDLGGDGIVRIDGPRPPWDLAIEAFGYGTSEGLENWAYLQADHPEQLERPVAAYSRQMGRLLPFILESPGDFVTVGSVNGLYGPQQFEDKVLPFLQTVVAALHERGKATSLHAHMPAIRNYGEVLRLTGVDVIEAFTPPPVGDWPLSEARALWGGDIVIWVNFPETVFFSGYEATKAYTAELLRSDPPGDALVIGFTECGLDNVVDDDAERLWKSGTLAIMQAIEEHGIYPVH